MIFKSRTTKELSKVTEQKAWSLSLFSATSLMRTSVMTTAELLVCRVRTCGTAGEPAELAPSLFGADDEQPRRRFAGLRIAGEPLAQPLGQGDRLGRAGAK